MLFISHRVIFGLTALAVMLGTSCAVVSSTNALPVDSSSTSQLPSSVPVRSAAPLVRHGRTGDVVAHAPRRAVFGKASQWRLDVRHAPISRDSPDLVANLTRQVQRYYGGVAAFNNGQYGVSTYVVTNEVPRGKVIWDNCQNKSYRPPQLYDRKHGAAFRDVPIPRSAVPASGTDGELSIYNRESDQLWEFWQAHREVDGWHACWGGRIDHVSRSPGYYLDGMGVSASGLSSLAGAVTMADVRSGRIDHAISLAIVDVAHWSDVSFPAQRSDGSDPLGKPGSIQEGRRFRLPASLRLNALDLTPLAKMIARAAKRYGFIITDKSGCVAVAAETSAGLVAAGHADPWPALLNGTPAYAVMRNFPWSQLETLPTNYAGR